MQPTYSVACDENVFQRKQSGDIGILLVTELLTWPHRFARVGPQTVGGAVHRSMAPCLF